MMKNFLFVFFGGGVGSVIRYLLSVVIPQSKTSFPWSTFLANATGCFIIGWLYAFYLRQENPTIKLLLITGFCGGFTTFSTFSYEAIQMIQASQWMSFAFYILLSLLCCFLFTWLGIKLG